VGHKINPDPDLTFKDKISNLRKLGKGEWITVFSIKEENNECTFCALIPVNYTKTALKDASWDLHIGSGMPELWFSFENGEEIATYHRFSDDEVEPLIFCRNFHGIKDEYWEISEEFRQYFNFYEDKKNNKFFFIDDNGDEHEAIIIEKDEIRIKSKYLLEFLAIKKMDLALFF
jgi:hypothetical protein